MDTTVLEQFQEYLQQAVDNKQLVRLTLSKHRQKSAELKRVTVRPVQLKAGYRFNFQYQYATRDESQNLEPKVALESINHLVENNFLEANLFTVQQHIGFISNRKGNARLTSKMNTEPLQADLKHEQSKKRWIKNTTGHWNDLGLTDKQGRLKPAMHHKFKQIDTYIQLLEPMITQVMTNRSRIQIVDMGAGKGYLTFALFEFLATYAKLDFELIGVEQRPELVNATQAIATKYGYQQLRFEQGAIASFPLSKIDVLIALHACDTATDDAIAAGIKADAELIVCAPCCHKQIRNEMKAVKQASPILQYGILLERQAEMLTDTLRALIMEKYGYKSHIQEFIEAGHTPKNLLITGIKTDKPTDIHQINRKINELKKQFGIQTHYLETVL
ncbi:MAG: SAM-dependent methyltransferase [Bacteroidales bacterium]|nr:SAM-dependent methyltransferase [Bacteroidales bacterium]